MVKPYRRHVFVCTASGADPEMGTPADPERCRFCSDKGGEAVRAEFWAALARAGMGDVKVTRMGCTVQPRQGPVVIVYPDGVWYAGVGVGDVAEIVSRRTSVRGGLWNGSCCIAWAKERRGNDHRASDRKRIGRDRRGGNRRTERGGAAGGAAAAARVAARPR